MTFRNGYTKFCRNIPTSSVKSILACFILDVGASINVVGLILLRHLGLNKSDLLPNKQRVASND